ncbi:hypothetical protein R3P38DRAFT_2757695 [Favolaschia claudopus]|uniref:Uncharacterized protein n=1 Tax=Favolaschia claudopus TaxID=2862362 RepID=A0AAW0EA18_9AGAR
MMRWWPSQQRRSQTSTKSKSAATSATAATKKHKTANSPAEVVQKPKKRMKKSAVKSAPVIEDSNRDAAEAKRRTQLNAEAGPSNPSPKPKVVWTLNEVTQHDDKSYAGSNDD